MDKRMLREMRRSGTVVISGDRIEHHPGPLHPVDAMEARLELVEAICRELEREIEDAYEGDDTAYAVIRLAHERAQQSVDEKGRGGS